MICPFRAGRKAPRVRTTTDEDRAIKAKDYPHLKIGGWARREIFGSRKAQLRFRQRHFDNIQKLFPNIIKDGHYVCTYFEKVGSDTNILTDFIHDFLVWEGHDPNRIDTKGTAIVDKEHAPRFNLLTNSVQYTEKTTYIPTKTKKGTADIHCDLRTPNISALFSWHIEVKTGSDRLSDAQKKVQKQKGEWYCVVRNLDDLFYYYDERMNVLNSLSNSTLF